MKIPVCVRNISGGGNRCPAAAAAAVAVLILTIVFNDYRVNRAAPVRLAGEFLDLYLAQRFDAMADMCSDVFGAEVLMKKKLPVDEFNSCKITGRKFFGDKSAAPEDAARVLLVKLAELKREDAEIRKKVEQQKQAIDERIRRESGLRDNTWLLKKRIELERDIWKVSDRLHGVERNLSDLEKTYLEFKPDFELNSESARKCFAGKSFKTRTALVDARVSGKTGEGTIRIKLRKRVQDGWKITGVEKL